MTPQEAVKQLREACETDDSALIFDAVADLAAASPNDLQQELAIALNGAVRSAATHIITGLISRGAPVGAVDPSCFAGIAHAADGGERSSNKIIEVLEILLSNGWDINRRDMKGPTESLRTPAMWWLVYDRQLVEWCLAHGASVHAKGQEPPEHSTDWHRCLTVLEQAAGNSTVPIFELLRARGAPLGTRTLQQACETASYQGLSEDTHDDPDLTDCERAHRRVERLRMVYHLVDELKLDVQASDEFGKNGRIIPGRLGTGLDYALHTAAPTYDNTELVMFLVRRGADACEALRASEADNVVKTVQALKAWMASQTVLERSHI